MSRIAKKKATFVLPENIMEAMRSAVNKGKSPSVSAFVVQAIEQRLQCIQEEELESIFKEAATDPDFIEDMNTAMNDFRFVDAEATQMIPQ